MWVLFVMNICLNTCVFPSAFVRSTKHIKIWRNSHGLENSSFSFVCSVLPILFSCGTASVYLGTARVVVYSSVRILSATSFGTKVSFFSEIANCVYSIIGDCVVWKYQRNHSTGFIRKPDHSSDSRTRRDSNFQRFKKTYATSPIQTISLWGLCLSDRKISIYY